MHRFVVRVLVTGAACAGLSAVGVAGASASTEHAVVPVTAPRASQSQATHDPGAQLWAQRYHGPGNGDDSAASVAVSPGGGTVFVTGSSRGATTGDDYATVAYNATTGTQLWAKRYHGPGNGDDVAASVGVSPDGGTVFVTGSSSARTDASGAYATVAYNATTGTQLWAKSYHGPGNGAAAASVAVSPDGGTVFVTGSSFASTRAGDDYATVAYNAATGAQLWAKRYRGPAGGGTATSMTVSPDGTAVFVTGYSTGSSGTGFDYATVAYNTATGAQLWAKRYRGPAGGDMATSVAVSPDGTTVFVTGSSLGKTAGSDYATVAYSATTGDQLWVSRYNGSANAANSVAVSPDGRTVYITGYSLGAVNGEDYATVAYGAATGAQLWVKRYNGPGNFTDAARAVVVSPGAGTVVVTGISYGATSGADIATVGYDPTTGAQLWVKRYNGPGNGDDAAASAATGPAGTVFVTGSSDGGTTGNDYATVAYSG